MKYFFALPAALLAIGLAFPVHAEALAADQIISENAILMDADTGQVLFDKGMYEMKYPASTTKVLTGLLVAENSSMDEVMTVSESAVDPIGWDSSQIALQEGEEITVEDAMYALMLPSANDAANVLAEHVGGTTEHFAELLTARAHELGAVNTNFVNAHGLHDPNHYTTVYDMALLTRYAAQNETFMEYFGAGTYTIEPTNKQEEQRPLSNYHYMLVPGAYYQNPEAIGGKVGYTQEARHTMTTVARRAGRTLVCVVMDSPNRWDKFKDTNSLLEYGFTRFNPVSVPEEAFATGEIPAGKGKASFFSDGDFHALLRDDLRPADITVAFNLPQAFYEGEALPESVEVRIDSGDPTLPDLLGIQPLQRDIVLPPPLQQVNTPSASDAAMLRDLRLLPILVTVLAAVVLALCGAVVSRYIWLQKRRRARIRQFDRRIGRYYRQEKSA